MKKHAIFAITLCMAWACLAQAPASFGYQIVVRDDNNRLISNKTVSAQVSLIWNFATGRTNYKETHTATTNAAGLLSLEIGKGAPQTGRLQDIDWFNGIYFLKIDIDTTGGTRHQISHTEQLNSVPYALSATKAKNAPGVDSLIEVYNGRFNRLDSLAGILHKGVKDIDSAILLRIHDTINDTRNGVGVFSVSPSRTVAFAPGNLQFRKSDSTWHLATQQYGIIDTADNLRIFDTTFTGKIDYLSWGASGYNDLVPCDTTMDSAIACHLYGGDFQDLNGTPYDWGYHNSISFRDTVYPEDSWRTPTIDEWEYVLSQRPNALGLLSLATVNGITGLVLLPDDWSGVPLGCSFVPNAQDWYTNTYNGIFWTAMEAQGAVFLPANGYYCHHHVEIHDFLATGFYWSSSHEPTENNHAHYIQFGWWYLNGQGRMGYLMELHHDEKAYHHAVRLVKDVVKTSGE